MTQGACRENITNLAACNAAEKAMNQLTIFKGKNYRRSWAGDKVFPSIFYSL